MGFLKYVTKKLKFLLPIALVAGMASQLILPALSTSASAPRFNFLAGDYEMLRGVNKTENGSVFTDPVTGQVGDEFRGLIYYHNGMVDTVAENTRVKVTLPSSTDANNSGKVTATIGADNAETISDTIVDGQVVGLSGLTTNLNGASNFEFVPGSVKWFPNRNQSGSNDPTPLPNGQSGDEIISANGINLGGINGCWSFAGFVSFGFRSVEKPAPALDLTKEIRNVDESGTFVKRTSGTVGQTVEYRVTASNTGNVVLLNSNLKDALPSGLTFESGSLKKIVDGVESALPDNDAAGLFSANGLTVSRLDIGSPVSYLFRARIVSSVATPLTNRATIVAGSLSATDTALLDILCPNIVKSKSAYNDTKHEVANMANPGDLITYTLTARNTGTADVASFVVEDGIADILRLADVVAISNGGSVVAGTTGYDAKMVRWPAANLNAGSSLVRTFQVKIKDPLPQGTTNFVIKNIYGNQVTVTVVPPVVCPDLHVDKYVRDVTTNEANFVKANEAFSGDTLEYQVGYSNTGAGAALNVKFTDALPVNGSYVLGSARISRNGNAEVAIPDTLTNGGFMIDRIEPGESGMIKFKVKIATGIAEKQVLTNTVYLTHDEKTISDTAKTTIIVKAAAPVKELPKSGPAGSAGFFIAFFMGLGVLYGKYRGLIASEHLAIVRDLIG